MDTILQEALESGEQLRWSGSPESFEVLDKTNRKQILVKAAVAVAVAVLLLVEYVLIVGKSGTEVKPLAVIIIVACCGYFCLDPFLRARQLTKLRYAITDRRLLSMSDGVKSVYYKNIPAVCFKKDEDGHVTLLCGTDAVKLKPKKWRSAALYPMNDVETNACESFAFYALPDADRVKTILRDYVTIL